MQLVGVFCIFAFVYVLTYSFFILVRRRFHLRVNKVEELLGLDSFENAQRIRTTMMAYINEPNRANMARLTLMQLLESRNDLSAKKKRSRGKFGAS